MTAELIATLKYLRLGGLLVHWDEHLKTTGWAAPPRRGYDAGGRRHEADHVRAIPLPAVLRALGAEPDRHNPHKWHTPAGVLSVNGAKFINWNRGRGGRRHQSGDARARPALPRRARLARPAVCRRGPARIDGCTTRRDPAGVRDTAR